MPHWPPGGTRYLVTADVEVVNLTTGAIEYQHQYPLGNLGGQTEISPRGDWVLVAASPDGRYLAESGVFNGTTIIRDASTGKQLSSLPGSVTGFSWDGSRVVVNIGSGGAAEAQVLTWADQRVIWRASGVAQSTQARPDSSDVLIGMATAGGNASDLVVVRGDGTSSIVVWNAAVVKP
jgi:WD40 repeat protein